MAVESVKSYNNVKYGAVTDKSSEIWGNWRPTTLLVLFMVTNFFIFMDRGILAGCISKIMLSEDLTNFQGGVLGSVFFATFSFGSPIFAHMADMHPPMRILNLGVVTLACASFATGMAPHFSVLIVARALSGFGEASFISTGVTLLDQLAPEENKGAWMSYLFSMGSVGFAFGALAGAAISDINVDSWRLAFFLEAICWIPVILVSSRIKGPSTMLELAPKGDRESLSFFQKTLRLAQNPIFLLLVLASSCVLFVQGAVGYWLIPYFEETYGVSQELGSIMLLISLLFGTVGMILGGIALDYFKGPDDSREDALFAAFKVLVPLSLLAALAAFFTYGAHNTQFDCFAWFCTWFIICVTMVMSTYGPSQSAMLWSTNIQERAFAMGIATVIGHVLGDAFSPMLVGMFADHVGWERAFFYMSFWLAGPLACFALACCLLTPEAESADGKKYSDESNYTL